MNNATNKRRMLGILLSFLLAFGTMLQTTMPALPKERLRKLLQLLRILQFKI